MTNLVSIENITSEQLASVCDHTFLNRSEAYKANAKPGENPIDLRAREFQAFLDETKALEFKPYAVCVRPEDVRNTKKFLDENRLSKIVIASVVGFPDGSLYDTAFKVEEAKIAINHGAKEIDMVLNYAQLKSDLIGYMANDILYVVKTAHSMDAMVKVIFETSELSNSDIEKASEICNNVGADFIKTSTGYSSQGATSEALKIMRANFPRGVKMSGGIRQERVKELLYAVSGRDDGMIDLDPMKIRIGESRLLTGRADSRKY